MCEALRVQGSRLEGALRVWGSGSWFVGSVKGHGKFPKQDGRILKVQSAGLFGGSTDGEDPSAPQLWRRS